MSDYILMADDQVIFDPTFGVATVVVRPGMIPGNGGATVTGKKLCVDGDEGKVSVPSCTYVAGGFSVPGIGTLKIQQLAPNQKATKTKSANKPVLLKGGDFIAVFEVQAPAQMPPPASTPDPMIKYIGKGNFITLNAKFKGA